MKHQGLYKNEKEEQNQANHKFIDIPVQFASDLLTEQTNEKLGTIIHKNSLVGMQSKLIAQSKDKENGIFLMDSHASSFLYGDAGLHHEHSDPGSLTGFGGRARAPQTRFGVWHGEDRRS